jgi:hypothetical protein
VRVSVGGLGPESNDNHGMAVIEGAVMVGQSRTLQARRG